MLDRAPEIDELAIEIVQHLRLRGLWRLAKQHPRRAREEFHVADVRRKFGDDPIANAVLPSDPPQRTPQHSAPSFEIGLAAVVLSRCFSIAAGSSRKATWRILRVMLAPLLSGRVLLPSRWLLQGPRELCRAEPAETARATAWVAGEI